VIIDLRLPEKSPILRVHSEDVRVPISKEDGEACVSLTCNRTDSNSASHDAAGFEGPIDTSGRRIEGVNVSVVTGDKDSAAGDGKGTETILGGNLPHDLRPASRPSEIDLLVRRSGLVRSTVLRPVGGEQGLRQQQRETNDNDCDSHS
jgi:hypothetical protein